MAAGAATAQTETDTTGVAAVDQIVDPIRTGKVVQVSNAFVHPTAIVESDSVGAGTRVWAFAHVLAGATVGANCSIGDHCFIEGGAVVGDNVTIKNGNFIWVGVTVEDGAFIGPGVIFSNDRWPRSPRLPEARARYSSWPFPSCAKAAVIAAFVEPRRRSTENCVSTRKRRRHGRYQVPVPA